MIILALAVSLWAATKQKDAWKPSSLLFPPLFILCTEETGKFLIYFYICTVSSLIKKMKVNHFKLNCKTNEPITGYVFILNQFSSNYNSYEYDSLYSLRETLTSIEDDAIVKNPFSISQKCLCTPIQLLLDILQSNIHRHVLATL